MGKRNFLSTFFKKFIVILLALTLSSCATIFQNPNDITVTSTDGPLQVRVTDGSGTNEVHTTPFIYDTTRYRDVVFTVVSDEYESQKFFVERKIRWLMFILDTMTPFLVGLVIDFASGKIYEHDTKHLIINNKDLARKKVEAIKADKKEFIARIDFELLGLDEEKEASKILAHKELKFTKI